MRSAAVTLLALAAVACGGKVDATCPAGPACTETPEGGTTPPVAVGPTSIATRIQATPTNLASDGTNLYWSSFIGSGNPISSVPVGGGAISTVVPGPVPGGFLAVDKVNVYYPGQSGGYYRSPKGGGGPATLITPLGKLATTPGETILGLALLEGNAYWVEAGGSTLNVLTAPAQGGAMSILVTMESPGAAASNDIAVTSNTVFIASAGLLSYFPLYGAPPSGGLANVSSAVTAGCGPIVSDTNAVYCDGVGGAIVAVADDGSTTTLGTALGGTTFLPAGAAGPPGNIALDDTYLYWVNSTTDGTIMRVPKAGGTATILASDASPIAIAVDANAVYWSDQAGNIMRLPK